MKDEKTLLVQQPIEQILPRSECYAGAANLRCNVRRFAHPTFERTLQSDSARGLE